MQAANTHDHEHAHEHHHHHHDHRAETVQGWLKTLLLLGLGAYFAYNIYSGNLSNYINVRFVWLSYVAAAIFLLLGVGNTFLLLRSEKQKHKHDDHDHAHGGMSWGALGIVALPLLLGVLVPSRPLGASAVDGDLSLNAASVSSSNLTFTVPPLERNILDWLRVFNTVEDYSELDGEPADLTGFVYTEPSFGENRFMVARFTISCCVADASAIGVPVAWNEANSLQADTWVRVQGAFQVDDFGDDRLPVLEAESVTPVEQPEHPYLYP